MEITNHNASELSMIFSMNTMKQLAGIGDKKNLRKLLNKNDYNWLFEADIKLRDIFNNAFSFLSQNYKNEYIYKNILINHLLGKNPNIHIFSEFPVKKCITDLVVVSDSIAAYEIKTDLDNFRRFDDQFNEYQKVFEFVNVVISKGALKKFDYQKYRTLGVVILDDTNKIMIRRKPKSNFSNIDFSYIWGMLNQREKSSFMKRISHTNDYEKSIKKLPSFMLHASRKQKRDLYNIFLELLSKRSNQKSKMQLINSVPKSLKAFAYQANFTNTEVQLFNTHLRNNTQYIISNKILEDSNVLSLFKR